MPNYDYYCEPCHEDRILQVKYEQRDMVDCPVCCEPMKRQVSMPMNLRASYPDGMRRKGWQDLKEASKLNVDAAGARAKEKAEIKKEIRKIGVEVEK